MLKGKAVWKIQEQVDSHVVSQLVDELQLDPILAQLLVRRGLVTCQQVQQFMSAESADFHDPFLLKGMDQSVKRIREAIEEGENIWIYGDYDADGVTATSLLLSAIRKLGGKVEDYIPHRVMEGYGLNNQAIDQACEQHVTLIITVDNGISAHETIDYANEQGIDIIVTDHHEPPDDLPQAFAIINPKQAGCSYPFKHLAGVGVAFKLVHALFDRLPTELIQLAAIGTIADIVTLVGENRLLVQLGLEQLRHQPLPGVKALANVSGFEIDVLDEGYVAFQLAPRINAAGRLSEARAGMELLSTSDPMRAEQLAQQLEWLNRERQQMVQEITDEALAMLQAKALDRSDTVFILEHENWHVGVIGIVASKIVEQFHRPTIILSVDPETGMAKGSARSIPGFDMYYALSQCATILSHYGGHQMAAGLTMQKQYVPELRKQMNALAASWLSDEQLIPVYEAEMACTIEQLSLPCIEAIEGLAPFGEGNPKPSFVLNNLRLHDIRMIGRERQHLKLLVSQETGDVKYTLDAIGFGIGDKAPFISPHARVDLLGEITINEWNGIRKPQLLIQDLRVNERQVFDWRGMKVDQWATRLQPQWRPSLLLTVDGGQAVATDERVRAHCSLWVMTDAGEVEPANEAAERCAFDEVEDLIVCALPERIDILSAVLGKASAVERIYIAVKNDDRTAGTLPSRELFRRVYAELLNLKQWQVSDQRIWQGLQRRTGISQELLRFILNVFSELSFIEQTGSSYHFVQSPDHRSLSSSASYIRRKQFAEVHDLLVYATTQELVHWVLTNLNRREYSGLKEGHS